METNDTLIHLVNRDSLFSIHMSRQYRPSSRTRRLEEEDAQYICGCTESFPTQASLEAHWIAANDHPHLHPKCKKPRYDEEEYDTLMQSSYEEEAERRIPVPAQNNFIWDMAQFLADRDEEQQNLPVIPGEYETYESDSEDGVHRNCG